MGIIFGVIMFIIALIAYNQSKLESINYPADRKGNVCVNSYDETGRNYPFIYFNDINDPLGSRYKLYKNADIVSENALKKELDQNVLKKRVR